MFALLYFLAFPGTTMIAILWNGLVGRRFWKHMQTVAGIAPTFTDDFYRLGPIGAIRAQARLEGSLGEEISAGRYGAEAVSLLQQTRVAWRLALVTVCAGPVLALALAGLRTAVGRDDTAAIIAAVLLAIGGLVAIVGRRAFEARSRRPPASDIQ